MHIVMSIQKADMRMYTNSKYKYRKKHTHTHYMYICKLIYKYIYTHYQLELHKAVAEVSKIGNL